MSSARILGIVGWSGSGKTTLITRLIPVLTARGIRVATVKHAHHKFDVDQPGKDSYEHRKAGACEVIVSSARRWVQMHEVGDGTEATLPQLLAKVSPCDLILVEGFKTERHPKLEVFREAAGNPPCTPMTRASWRSPVTIPSPRPEFRQSISTTFPLSRTWCWSGPSRYRRFSKHSTAPRSLDRCDRRARRRSCRRKPAQIPIGALGDMAFSLVQSSGLKRKVPFGLKVLLVRNPAVAYSPVEQVRNTRAKPPELYDPIAAPADSPPRSRGSSPCR